MTSDPPFVVLSLDQAVSRSEQMEGYIMACEARVSLDEGKSSDISNLIACQSESLSGVKSQSYGTNTTKTACSTLSSWMDPNGSDECGILALSSLEF